MTARSAAYERFIASMVIDYMKWHDGDGYDLDALDELTGPERDEVETLLVGRKGDDWRDVEGLARLNTPKAIEALEQSARTSSSAVRLRASELLRELDRPTDFDTVIVEALRHGGFGDGLSESIRLAAEHPSPAVEAELLRGALCATDGRAVHFAALLFFLHGKAAEPFDWNHRPFFLRFNAQDKAERRAAFDELCATIGVDGSRVTCADG